MPRGRATGAHGRRLLVATVVSAGALATTVAALTIALPGATPTTDRVVATGPRAAAIAGAARREIRPTLDPVRFTGKAAAAYQVAREIPAVLDQLRCYCACGSQYGHVSLLSCYTDGHGST